MFASRFSLLAARYWLLAARYSEFLLLSSVSSGFHNWMRRRPPDHLVEIRPGRHHRVHGIFLLDAEVDERRPTVPASRHDRAFNVAPLVDRSCLNAERFAQLHEIRSSDWRRGVALFVEELLPLPHHPEIAVIDDADVDVEALLNRRC